MTRILLAWTAVAAISRIFHSSRKNLPMDVVTLSQGNQDTIAKNNLRRITFKPVWGINLTFLPFMLSIVAYCHEISSSI